MKEAKTMETPRIQPEMIPDHTKEMLNSSLVSAIRLAFQDPAVVADYEEWRRKRSIQKGEPA